MNDIFATDISLRNNFIVLSKSFKSGKSIPTLYSYQHGNVSPELSWTAGPKGTKSYVVICQDPDAPRKDPWVHWVVFNIPGDVLSLAQGLSHDATLDGGIQQGYNDYEQIGWSGPNPPSGTHRYYFYVYALDSYLPELRGKTPTKNELEKVMKKHGVLAIGLLIGTYIA